MAQAFEFAIVGRGALATACTQHILERGLTVRALVSTDPEVAAWAAQRGLLSGPDLRLLAGVKNGSQAVLLSISNDRLVPAELLEAFDIAINFHDAPLPEYSGSHATSWALMAREREYGITWHRMTTRADAGEIVLREPITVTADETAFSLNGKTHDAALASFPRLLEGIVTDSLEGRPQNLARRMFYPRDRRPDRCAVLDFGRPAHELEALARALSCGHYPNRLALPKLWTGDDFVVVRRIDVMAMRSRSTPGTVLRVGDETIEIATTTHDVRLGELWTQDGKHLDGETLVQCYALRPGEVAPGAGGELNQALADVAPCHWRDEEFWMQRIRELRPLVLPAVGEQDEPAEIIVAGEPAQASELLAQVTAWLARITGLDRFDIGLEDAQVRGPLVARVRPFSVAIDREASFHAHRSATAEAHADWLQRAPYLREAPLRYPGIPMLRGWKHFLDWPVVVALCADDDEVHASLRIAFDPSSGTTRFQTCAGGLPRSALREMAAQFGAWRGAVRSSEATALGSIAAFPIS